MCDHMDTEIEVEFLEGWEGDFYVQKESEIHHCQHCNCTFSIDELTDLE
jgi:hypothetical protein